LNASLSVVQETMHNTNVVFKVRMFFGWNLFWINKFFF
jgi:hypothetical protein